MGSNPMISVIGSTSKVISQVAEMGRRKYTVVTIVGDRIETDTQGYFTGSNPVLTTKLVGKA